ncbi:MAG: adenosylcobinamide-phosphate synthase CbiB [Desulfitobacteriia bacterium]|jgi:adenosylcobinamide-phosphate synthase
MSTSLALIIGYILDLLLGDPPRLPHPVRGMGKMIAGGEYLKERLNLKNPLRQYLGGLLLSLAVIGTAFILPLVILKGAYYFHPYLSLVLEGVMCYQILAVKSLKEESMKVYYHLKKSDLEAARESLSFIVGRDTENLNESQVIKGAVETVAENSVDGIIAPLFYILFGGAPLGFAYKAINTLDSMIGYRNEKYLYFGRFAAKLDDFANYIPARITAYLMLFTVFLSGWDFKGALKIYRRDRNNHASPNSAHPEAVCAGALNIQLGGDSFYSGRLVSKPLVGDHLRKPEINDIPRTNKLVFRTAFLGLIVGTGLKTLLLFLF